MTFKKILSFLLLPFLLQFAVSCCNCIAGVIGRYSHKELSINHLDNSGREPIVATTASVLKAAYGIRIGVLRERTACLNPNKTFLFSTAYACDCPPDLELRPQETMVNFAIETINAFDSTHAAQSDITNYFRLNRFGSLRPVTDLLTEPAESLFSETQLLNQFDLLLTVPPTLGSVHQFKLKIQLSDGRFLEQTSTIITLR